MNPFDALVPPHVFRLVCRPALPMDTRDVLELTRTIWEGHDYIPFVWQEWLRDPQGLLAVAEFGGRVVGISKLSRLSRSEWWLEGLRVHPDFQGRGIASHLNDYLLEYWASKAGEILRLVTASFRVQVQHLCQHSGFQKIAEVTPFVAEPVPGPAERFSPFMAGEEGMALEMSLRAPALTLPGGLIDIGWQWVSPSLENIGFAVAQERAWWWGSEPGGREALLLAREDEEDDGQRLLVIQLIACPLERLAACLEDYRRLAGSLGLGRAAWFAPLDAALEPSLQAAGYQRDWEESLYIYEKISG
jgi:GNAT superfamily N-acetyltransferase